MSVVINSTSVENENENITIKTNLIDSGNNETNANSSDLSKLCKAIKKQENEINKDEKLKRNLQTTYFKDNKDK